MLEQVLPEEFDYVTEQYPNFIGEGIPNITICNFSISENDRNWLTCFVRKKLSDYIK